MFEFGADDVVAFGIAIDELTARIKALVRRATGTFSRGSQTIMPGVVLDTGRQRLQLGEREFALTGREFRFLLALSANPGNTVTFLDLAEAIWGTRLRDDDALRALVKRLRVKLGEARPLVHAHYGIGYDLDTACAEVVPR